MRQEIEDRFKDNMDRVEALVTTYRTLSGVGQGRATVGDTDVLRAAVVLLHASMEDLLRSITEWKLPTAPPDSFKDISFMGKKEKYSLAELAAYRGRSVDDVIGMAIAAMLDESSYNNVPQVFSALRRVGIDPVRVVPSFAPTIDALTKRRHWIVHRTDRNVKGGTGQHRARSLSASTVAAWIRSIKDFGAAVLAAC